MRFDLEPAYYLDAIALAPAHLRPALIDHLSRVKLFSVPWSVVLHRASRCIHLPVSAPVAEHRYTDEAVRTSLVCDYCVSGDLAPDVEGVAPVARALGMLGALRDLYDELGNDSHSAGAVTRRLRAVDVSWNTVARGMPTELRALLHNEREAARSQVRAVLDPEGATRGTGELVWLEWNDSDVNSAHPLQLLPRPDFRSLLRVVAAIHVDVVANLDPYNRGTVLGPVSDIADTEQWDAIADVLGSFDRNAPVSEALLVLRAAAA